MTDKVWTSTDISKGKITIEQLGSNIKFGFRYRFLDSGAMVIEELPTRTFVKTIAFSSLPTSISDALIIIQNHLYNAALAEEGMN